MEYIEDADEDALLDALLDEASSDEGSDEANVLIHREDPDDYHHEVQDDDAELQHTTEQEDSDEDFSLNRKLKTRRKRKIKKETKKVKVKEISDSANSLLTTHDECNANPNFAVIVDFLDKFAEHLDIKPIPIKSLECHLKDTSEKVDQDLIQIHTALLKRVKLSKKMLVTRRSWEKALLLFCKKSKLLRRESIGTELENVGYSELDVNVKLKILKVLMEAQFDVGDFKVVTETLPVESLRHEPAGRDVDGRLYWTLTDEFAEIRVFTEDVNHLSWECPAGDRLEFESLIENLQQNKLYRLELERRKMLEAKKQEELDLLDQIKKLEEKEKNQSEVDTEDDEVLKCEVCSEEFGAGPALMSHYAATHLAEKMKEKFSHLVDKLVCKLCKEPLDEDTKFVHIAVTHNKINGVLMENDLKPIGAVKSASEETNQVNQESATFNEDKIDDTKTLQLLEKKLKDVQKQMSNSDNANLQVYALADIKDIAEDHLELNDDGNEESNAEVVCPKHKTSKKSKAKKKNEKWSVNKKDAEVKASRRSTRSRSNKDMLHGKIVDVTKESKVKERLESRMSCYKCGKWEVESSNRVYPCKQCGHGWHGSCVVPALEQRPGSGWQCPVCDHCDLVTALAATSAELLVLMERVEERRLAEMEVNQSMEVDQDDDGEEEEEEEVNEVKPKDEGPEAASARREVVRNVPDYYESSDEDEPRAALPSRKLTCTCARAGAGGCLWCKKMRGCTCEGQGTCRMCELEAGGSDSGDTDIEIIEDTAAAPPAEMSTTEMFLMTGKIVRTPSQEAEIDDDIEEIDPYQSEIEEIRPVQRGRGRARGRGRGVGRGVSNYIPQQPPNIQARPRLVRPPVARPRQPAPRPQPPSVRMRPVMRGGVRAPPPPGYRGPMRGQAGAGGYRGRGVVGVPGIRPLRPRPPVPGRGGVRGRGAGQHQYSQPQQHHPEYSQPQQYSHQYPRQPSPYQQYTRQLQQQPAPSHAHYASATSYYQQAAEEEDVIALDDDEDDQDVMQGVQASLPPGIQISRSYERVDRGSEQARLQALERVPPGIQIIRQ